jgi:hypothetical protein
LGSGSARRRQTRPDFDRDSDEPDRERPYLEAMLRQFEYEADLLAVDGKTGVDTAWLR